MDRPYSKIQQSAQALFDFADINFNGDRPWDIQVHNPELYKRILTQGSLGLGESYIDGWWDSEKLDVLFHKVLAAKLSQRLNWKAKSKLVWRVAQASLVNQQSVNRAKKVADVHYNLGNNLFEAMLDSSMNYSCGYWANAEDLEQSQQQKMELICQKLLLEPGMKVLDIGCGWGSLAKYMAERYGVKVLGLTISSEQQKLAQQRTEHLDVEILLKDYRAAIGEYDRIVSVGMFEHVGGKNYLTYFQKVHELLSGDGIFLLHTIGTEDNRRSADQFIQKYIFPNGRIPNRNLINSASLDLFKLEDWHNFGPDYDKTLMAWNDRFEQAWPNLKDDYSEQFYRLWRYYLHCCAGYFRSREGQLWQLVYTKTSSSRSYHRQR